MRIQLFSSTAGRFPTPPATSATVAAVSSTAPPATAQSAWTCWRITPSLPATPLYVSPPVNVFPGSYLCRTKFFFFFFRSHPAHFVRFGCEMQSMSTTSVWLWLPMWLRATNLISALSGGVRITAVSCLPVNTTFNSQRIRTKIGLSAQN